MRKGQYVRFPVILEEYDDVYPRSFVLGQITRINKMSDEVSVRPYDFHNSKSFYAKIFSQTTFPRRKVDRCDGAKDSLVQTSMGYGRILSKKAGKTEDDFTEYFIRLETGEIQSFTEDQIEIEYTAADYEPVKQMLHYEFQNPSWYANRIQVSRNMHMVDNTIYGFKELAGCRTFLMAHQISTIARSFESRPIRYMLADEVGLGKTIEACSIIKILSSEKKDLRVLYIVPEALVNQWASELQYKYGITAAIGSYQSSIADQVIISLDELNETSEILDNPWDILIVDETHRLLKLEDKFQTVLCLSQKTENVLLLSATPIQDRKEEYLRLLSLLQPERYCQMSDSEFSAILDRQKKIQRRLNSVLSQMDQYEDYKEDSLEKLETLASDLEDPNLTKIIDGIDLQSEDMGKAAMELSVSYISENYRIERNVIRNRRDFISETLGKRCLCDVPYTMSSLVKNYCERNTYNSLLEIISEKINDDELGSHEICRLLQAMFSSPWALSATVDSMGLVDENLSDHLSLWTRQAENEIENMDYLLDEHPEEIRGRLLYAMDFIDQKIDISSEPNGKIVVFSEFPETLQKFQELLLKRGINCVLFTKSMSRESLEDSVYEFQNNDECRAILCDSTGGEGRNFQNADWLLHLDLPWTANEIEQRIGRLDRLGRDQDHLQVNSIVVYSEDTIEKQLFKIWNDGLDLFTRSLSGLEIITGDLNERIEEALRGDIYNGLENSLEDIIEITEDARDEVDMEEMYDSGSVIYRPLSFAVEQMLKTYNGEENNLFQASMLSWAEQAGLRSRKEDDKYGQENDEVVEFIERDFSYGASIQSLFIPPDWKSYEGTSIVRREGKILGTFDRGTAIKREDLLFYAPGDPLFDSIIDNAMDNGKGRCCAFSMFAPFNYIGFVSIYNVEPDISRLISKGIPVQLLSQFRIYLPMEQIVSIYSPFNQHGDVSAEQLTDFLFGVDDLKDAVHLGRRSPRKNSEAPIEIFQDRYPQNIWGNIVKDAYKITREKAIKQLKESADVGTAKNEINRIVSGYMSEYLYLGREQDELAEIRERYDAVYDALTHPKLKLDSMAFVWLARR